MSHALVRNQVCGQSFKPGDPIPTKGMWSRSGATGAGDPSCTNASSGELFYAYGFPTAYASNTGLDKVETDSIYFVSDTSGSLYLVLVHDMVGNSNGGSAKVLLSAPDHSNQLDVVLFDDIKAANYSTPGSWYGECSNLAQDCHSWISAEGASLLFKSTVFNRCFLVCIPNSFSRSAWLTQPRGGPTWAILGRGFLSWKWGKGGSDGVVFGPLPAGFAIDIQYLSLTGVDEIRIGSWDTVSNSMSYAQLLPSDALEFGVLASSTSCDSAELESVIESEQLRIVTFPSEIETSAAVIMLTVEYRTIEVDAVLVGKLTNFKTGREFATGHMNISAGYHKIVLQLHVMRALNPGASYTFIVRSKDRGTGSAFASTEQAGVTIVGTSTTTTKTKTTMTVSTSFQPTVTAITETYTSRTTTATESTTTVDGSTCESMSKAHECSDWSVLVATSFLFDLRNEVCEAFCAAYKAVACCFFDKASQYCYAFGTGYMVKAVLKSKRASNCVSNFELEPAVTTTNGAEFRTFVDLTTSAITVLSTSTSTSTSITTTTTTSCPGNALSHFGQLSFGKISKQTDFDTEVLKRKYSTNTYYECLEQCIRWGPECIAIQFNFERTFCDMLSITSAEHTYSSNKFYFADRLLFCEPVTTTTTLSTVTSTLSSTTDTDTSTSTSKTQSVNTCVPGTAGYSMVTKQRHSNFDHLISLIENVVDVEDCAHACSTNRQCVFFSYRSTWQYCNLFSVVKDTVDAFAWNAFTRLYECTSSSTSQTVTTTSSTSTSETDSTTTGTTSFTSSTVTSTSTTTETSTSISTTSTSTTGSSTTSMTYTSSTITRTSTSTSLTSTSTSSSSSSSSTVTSSSTSSTLTSTSTTTTKTLTSSTGTSTTVSATDTSTSMTRTSTTATSATETSTTATVSTTTVTATSTTTTATNTITSVTSITSTETSTTASTTSTTSTQTSTTVSTTSPTSSTATSTTRTTTSKTTLTTTSDTITTETKTSTSASSTSSSISDTTTTMTLTTESSTTVSTTSTITQTSTTLSSTSVSDTSTTATDTTTTSTSTTHTSSTSTSDSSTTVSITTTITTLTSTTVSSTTATMTSTSATTTSTTATVTSTTSSTSLTSETRTSTTTTITSLSTTTISTTTSTSETRTSTTTTATSSSTTISSLSSTTATTTTPLCGIHPDSDICGTLVQEVGCVLFVPFNCPAYCGTCSSTSTSLSSTTHTTTITISSTSATVSFTSTTSVSSTTTASTITSTVTRTTTTTNTLSSITSSSSSATTNSETSTTSSSTATTSTTSTTQTTTVTTSVTSTATTTATTTYSISDLKCIDLGIGQMYIGVAHGTDCPAQARKLNRLIQLCDSGYDESVLECYALPNGITMLQVNVVKAKPSDIALTLVKIVQTYSFDTAAEYKSITAAVDGFISCTPKVQRALNDAMTVAARSSFSHCEHTSLTTTLTTTPTTSPENGKFECANAGASGSYLSVSHDTCRQQAAYLTDLLGKCSSVHDLMAVGPIKCESNNPLVDGDLLKSSIASECLQVVTTMNTVISEFDKQSNNVFGCTFTGLITMHEPSTCAENAKIISDAITSYFQEDGIFRECLITTVTTTGSTTYTTTPTTTPTTTTTSSTTRSTISTYTNTTISSTSATSWTTVSLTSMTSISSTTSVSTSSTTISESSTTGTMTSNTATTSTTVSSKTVSSTSLTTASTSTTSSLSSTTKTPDTTTTVTTTATTTATSTYAESALQCFVLGNGHTYVGTSDGESCPAQKRMLNKLIQTCDTDIENTIECYAMSNGLMMLRINPFTEPAAVAAILNAIVAQFTFSANAIFITAEIDGFIGCNELVKNALNGAVNAAYQSSFSSCEYTSVTTTATTTATTSPAHGQFSCAQVGQTGSYLTSTQSACKQQAEYLSSIISVCAATHGLTSSSAVTCEDGGASEVHFRSTSPAQCLSGAIALNFALQEWWESDTGDVFDCTPTGMLILRDSQTCKDATRHLSAATTSFLDGGLFRNCDITTMTTTGSTTPTTTPSMTDTVSMTSTVTSSATTTVTTTATTSATTTTITSSSTTFTKTSNTGTATSATSSSSSTTSSTATQTSSSTSGTDTSTNTATTETISTTSRSTTSVTWSTVTVSSITTSTITTATKTTTTSSFTFSSTSSSTTSISTSSTTSMTVTTTTGTTVTLSTVTVTSATVTSSSVTSSSVTSSSVTSSSWTTTVSSITFTSITSRTTTSVTSSTISSSTSSTSTSTVTSVTSSTISSSTTSISTSTVTLTSTSITSETITSSTNTYSSVTSSSISFTSKTTSLTTSTSMTYTTTTPHPELCKACMYGSVGRCKLLSSGICVDPDPVTDECYYGTLTCSETAEIIFDEDYRSLWQSAAAEHDFRMKVLDAVTEVIGGSTRQITGLHLAASEGNSEGFIVSAVEFRGVAAQDVSYFINSQIAMCTICVAFNGKRLCGHGRNLPSCNDNPVACTPNPCENDGVCLPARINSTASSSFICDCAEGLAPPLCSGTKVSDIDIANKGNSDQKSEDSLATTQNVSIISAIVLFCVIAIVVTTLYFRKLFNEESRAKHVLGIKAIGENDNNLDGSGLDWDDAWAKTISPTQMQHAISAAMMNTGSRHGSYVRPASQMSGTFGTKSPPPKRRSTGNIKDLRSPQSGELIYASDNEPNYSSMVSPFARLDQNSFVNRFEEVYAQAVGRAKRGSKNPRLAVNDLMKRQSISSSASNRQSRSRSRDWTPVPPLTRPRSRHVPVLEAESEYSAISEMDFDAITLGDDEGAFSPMSPDSGSENGGSEPVYGLASRQNGTHDAGIIQSEPAYSVASEIGLISRLGKRAVTIDLGGDLATEAEDDYDIATIAHLEKKSHVGNNEPVYDMSSAGGLGIDNTVNNRASNNAGDAIYEQASGNIEPENDYDISTIPVHASEPDYDVASNVKNEAVYETAAASGISEATYETASGAKRELDYDTATPGGLKSDESIRRKTVWSPDFGESQRPSTPGFLNQGVRPVINPTVARNERRRSRAAATAMSPPQRPPPGSLPNREATGPRPRNRDLQVSQRESADVDGVDSNSDAVYAEIGDL